MGNYYSTTDPVAEARRHYLERITRFYRYWNPAKLVNPAHVKELLQRFEGREQELLGMLIHKYGPEPSSEVMAREARVNGEKRRDNDEISSALHDALRGQNNVKRQGSNLQLSKATSGTSAESAQTDNNGDSSYVTNDHLSKDEVTQDQIASISKRDGAFLGNEKQDLDERVEFMKELAKLRLPMPQTEGDFHASRVFMDDLGKSIYDPQQWMDYLQLKGYKL